MTYILFYKSYIYKRKQKKVNKSKFAEVNCLL